MAENLRVIAYLVAHFGKSGLWHAISLILPVVLVDKSGLPPVQMGVLTMASFFLSALLTLSFSTLVPRLNNPIGKLGSMQAMGSVMAGALFVACLLLPGGSGLRHLGLAVLLVCLLRAAYAFFDMAQNGLVALVRLPGMSHATIPAWRMIAGISAQLLMASSWSIVRPDHFGAGDRSEIWAATLSAVAIATALALRSAILLDKSRRKPQASSLPPPPTLLPGSLAGLLVATFAFAMLVSGVPRYLPFLPLPSAPPLCSDLTLYAAGGLAGQVLLLWHQHKFGRARTLQAALGLALLASVTLLLPASSIPIRAAAIFGCGTSIWALNTLLWTAMSERVGHAEASGLAPSHALSFALLAGVSECGTGLGDCLLGLVVHHARRLGDPALGMTILVLGAIVGLAVVAAAMREVSQRSCA